MNTNTACLTEEQQELVSNNMKLVDWIVYYQYYPNERIAGMSLEDLKQTGYLALCKAALSYDGRVQFATFAKRVVKNSLADYCRSLLERHPEMASLDAPLHESRDGSFHDVIPCVQAQRVWEDEEAQDVWNHCKARQKGSVRRGMEVIELRMNGYTDTEIARYSGRKRTQVSKWVSRARDRLCADPIVTTAFCS